MRRYRDRDFWYQIDHCPNQDGRTIRRYSVTCRCCGGSTVFNAFSASEEKMRKRLIHDGWEIGKHLNLHLCPACAAKHRDKPPAQKTPLELLESAWASCGEKDRKAFALKISQDYFPHPVKEEKPEIPKDDLPIDDEDNDPAEWWLEIQEKAARQAHHDT
jgi:hypothetical protein